MKPQEEPEKPAKLLFKTYLQAVRNSVGSDIFRNFYVKTIADGEFDAMQDGVLSCAFYVSGLLKIFGKVEAAHGTVASTIKDLEKSGWKLVDEPKPGDVLVWEKQEVDGDNLEHIGFYVGNGRAISNNYKTRNPQEHDMNFKDSKHREIIQIFRLENWSSDKVSK